MDDFQRRREEHRTRLVRLLSDCGPLALLAESVGNVGDGLIREGTRQLLADAGLPFAEVSADLDDENRAERTLVVRGSGGFDRLFHKFMPAVVLRASEVYRQVIIRPSSYDPREPVVARCLERPNVFAVARDLNSFDSLAPYGRRLAAMDCAVYHRRFTNPAPAPAETRAGDGTLIALRLDRGSPLPAHGLAPNAGLNEDISVTARDTADWLNRISAAERVVTDRLHVAVAAALLGRTLVIVDPYDGKLSACMNLAFGDAFADRIERRSVDWLVSEGLAVPAAGA